MSLERIVTDVRQSVAEILQENGRLVAFDDASSLIRSGLLSSMDLLGVVLSLESKGYGVVRVPLDKIDTVSEIAGYLAEPAARYHARSERR